MVQIALMIAQRESFSAVRIDNMLVFDWPTTEEPSTSDAVLLDLGLVPEDEKVQKQLFKEIPTEQIEAHKNYGRKAGVCETAGFMTRRLGRKGLDEALLMYSAFSHLRNWAFRPRVKGQYASAKSG